MDLSKFKTSDWLKVGGAVLILICGFLDWVTVEFSEFGTSASEGVGNAFDFFWTGTLPWILVVATGVLTLLLVGGVMKAGSVQWTMIFLAATALATLLLLIRVIFNPIEGSEYFEAIGGSYGRGIGMIGSTIGGILALVGSFMAFQAAGGNLADLKDPNKLKASFGAGGGQQGGGTPPPPPPPPGMTPPPPPPPAG